MFEWMRKVLKYRLKISYWDITMNQILTEKQLHSCETVLNVVFLKWNKAVKKHSFWL